MAVVGILIAAAIIGAVSAADLPPGPSTTITSRTTSYTTIISTSTSVSTAVSITTSAIPKGMIVTQLTDFLALPIGVSNVYISYSQIEIHTNGIGNLSTWLPAAPAGAIDLTTISNQSLTLGSSVVASGVYDTVRFSVTGATITYNARNITASVTTPEVSVPLPQGGIDLAPNGVSGFVLDVAPTIIPSPNGNTTAMELVPFAKVVVIPPSISPLTYTKSGSVLPIDTEAWFSSTSANLPGNLTILLELVSPSALTLVVNDTGTTSVQLSEISILGANLQNQNSQIASVQTTTSFTQVANGSTATKSMGSGHVSADSVPSPLADLSSNYQTVTSFLVLNNGSIVPSVTSASLQNNVKVGLTLQPGEHVQFLYIGKIPTLNSLFSPYSPLTIIPGGQYALQIVSPFGQSEEIAVTAVSAPSA